MKGKLFYHVLAAIQSKYQFDALLFLFIQFRSVMI